MHTTSCCELKIMVAKKFDVEIKLQKVIISLHIDKNLYCSSHNHAFDYSDSIKPNIIVRSTEGQKVAKSYMPTAVNQNLQGVKWLDNRDALKDAEGTYLDSKAIYNAGWDFQKVNPDIRMKGAKEEWEIQLTKIYKTKVERFCLPKSKQ